MKIIKFLKKELPSVLVIVVLLVVQAFCDLSLPTYTSQIVDIGIQQSGIPDAVPTQIRESTMNNLALFIKDSDMETVKADYTLRDGVYYLNVEEHGTSIFDDMFGAETNPELQKLDTAFAMPMVTLLGITQKGTDVSKIKAAITSGAMTKAQLQQAINSQMPDAYKNMSTKMLDTAAAVFVKSEYKAIGLNTDQMQTDYLYKVGGK